MTRVKNKTKPSFSEKHPKINFMIGLAILAVLIYVTCLIVQFIVVKLGEFFTWIGDFASNVDAVIVVALISGTVSIAVVIISTIVGKILERHFEKQKYLTERREKSYCDFVSMVYKVMDKAKDDKKYTNEQMISDIRQFSEQITLWGSSEVADKWISFRMTGMSNTDSKEMLYKLEEILNCMRNDLGVRKLKKGKLLSFFVNDIEKK